MTPLKQWRTKLSLKLGRSLSQEKAAEILGISMSYYNKLEYEKIPLPTGIKKRMKKEIDSVRKLP